MNIENEITPLAMVTKHLVTEIACSDPDVYIDEYNEIRTYKVLEYLGFKVAHSLYNKNIHLEEHTLVRCTDKPYLVYYADVYKGYLRKVKIGECNGKNIYDYHKLKYMYDKYNVLQPSDLSIYITPEELLDITEIGGVY